MTDTPEELWRPPAWLAPDVTFLLRAAVEGRLHTRTGRVTIAGWFQDHAEPAVPASDDQSETIGILEQRGCLTVGGRARLVDEGSGEEFQADCIVITSTGRELLDRLCSEYHEGS